MTSSWCSRPEQPWWVSRTLSHVSHVSWSRNRQSQPVVEGRRSVEGVLRVTLGSELLPGVSPSSWKSIMRTDWSSQRAALWGRVKQSQKSQLFPLLFSAYFSPGWGHAALLVSVYHAVARGHCQEHLQAGDQETTAEPRWRPASATETAPVEVRRIFTTNMIITHIKLLRVCATVCVCYRVFVLPCVCVRNRYCFPSLHCAAMFTPLNKYLLFLSHDNKSQAAESCRCTLKNFYPSCFQCEVCTCQCDSPIRFTFGEKRLGLVVNREVTTVQLMLKAWGNKRPFFNKLLRIDFGWGLMILLDISQEILVSTHVSLS